MEVFTPSPKFVNAIINHPDVRATAAQGTHKLFSEDLVTDFRNVAVAFEAGVALFRRVGPTTFDGHIFVLQGSRGKEALAFGKAALAKLADHPDARILHTGVPNTLPAARSYCRRLGLKPVGQDLFHEYFSSEIQQWAA